MSVQVRRRREAAAFLQTFVGAQGELLVDTTNNRVQVHDGVTPGGWPAAKLGEVLTSSRTPVADANYIVLPSDRTVAFTTLTASRVATLPSAANYPPGAQLVLMDESGACSATTTITVARAGSDTINGSTNAVLTLPFGFLALLSNGSGKWTIVDQSTATMAQQSAAAVAISGGSAAFASLTLGGIAVATTPQLNNRNVGINTNFVINQRGYASGTALSAGSYGHDRMKAGSGGCTYTFTQTVPDTTLTITAGTLIQAVDAPNICMTTYWLTWTGTATARVWQGSASGAFSGGTPVTIDGTAVNALLVSGLTIGTIANIEWSTGTLGTTRPWQFEAVIANAGPTRYERRHGELAVCQRYFEKSYSAGISPGSSSNSGCLTFYLTGLSASNNTFIQTVCFKGSKRITPTVTGYSTNSGAAGKAFDGNAQTDVNVGIYNIGDYSFQWSGSAASVQTAVYISMQFAANAEI